MRSKIGIPKPPKLLLARLIPSSKIAHASDTPLALPVLVVGIAADLISVSLLHTAEQRLNRNALAGDGQGSIYAPSGGLSERVSARGFV